MKRRSNAPDGKRPLPPRMGDQRDQTKKAGVREILSRHEGLAPVRSSLGSKPVRAFRAGAILAGHRIDRPVFIPGSAGFCSVAAGVSLCAHEVSAAAKSDGNRARLVCEGNGASPSLVLTDRRRTPETKIKQRSNNLEANEPGPRRRGALSRKRQGVRGRRKSLKRLDSAKKALGFEFGIPSASFGFPS